MPELSCVDLCCACLDLLVRRLRALSEDDRVRTLSALTTIIGLQLIPQQWVWYLWCVCIALLAMAGCFLPLASNEPIPTLLGDELTMVNCVPQGPAVAVDSKVPNYASMSGDLYVSVHHGSKAVDDLDDLNNLARANDRQD